MLGAMSEHGAAWSKAFATATTDGMERYDRVFVAPSESNIVVGVVR